MSLNSGKGPAADGNQYRGILIRYLAVSAFCAVFSLVYAQFSHEIRSPWMTWLFAWPLVMGALPAALAYLRLEADRAPASKKPLASKAKGASFSEKDGESEGIRKDIYHFGIAALTSASLLKGILEIAGTDSVLVSYLFAAGGVMAAAGAAAYFLTVIRK